MIQSLSAIIYNLIFLIKLSNPTANWEGIVIDNPLPAEYRIETDNNQTHITIANIKEGVYYHKYIENLPPLPRSKFNNKEELIEKIKKYLLFS